MNPDDYQKVKKIFNSVLEIEPQGRSAFLDGKCNGTNEVRAEVERLLASYDSEYLESPAVSNLAATVSADSFAAGDSVEHYTVIKKIGAGGMGEVYLAEDGKLGRQVAIKLLPEDLAADADRIRRFEQEARTASALNHPNILTIYDIGQAGPARFIVTEYIDGETLRSKLNQDNLPVSEALDIAVQCASALAAAHEAGVIHRDIKPENIMLRRDGLVKVLDFGLAKLVSGKETEVSQDAKTEKHFKTAPGVIMGTVRYMSPEQTRGHATDARTDIWSLGVVVYEMLVGCPPFASENAADVIAEIVKTRPGRISEFVTDVPERLEEIVAKTLEKDTDERYQAAKDLLIDLTRLKRKIELEKEFQTGVDGVKTERHPTRKPLESLSGTEYVLAGIKLHRGTSLWIFALIAALLLTSAFLARRYWRVTDPNAARLTYAANIKRAAEALETSNLDLAKQLLDTTRPKKGEEDLRSFEWGYLSRLHDERAASQPLVLPQQNHVFDIAFSPDSRLLATAGQDNKARLWNVATGEQKAEFAVHNGWLLSVAFSPDGKTLATGGFDEAARLWDIGTGLELFTIPSEKKAFAGLTFFAGGKMLAGDDGGSIKFWNAASGAEQTGFLNTLEAHNPFALSPDGKLFAARLRNDDRLAAIWDLASGRKLLTLRGHTSFITDLKFSRDSKALLTGGADRTARIWDLETGNELRRFTGHTDEILVVAYSADGSIAATGGKDDAIKLWDTKKGHLIGTLTGLQGHVRSLAFSSDGQKIASGGEENSVRIWNVPKGEARGVLRGHTAAAGGLSFSRDGKLLASASADKTAKIWDLETERDRHTFTGYSDKVNSTSFSPEGTEIATGSNDRRVMIWGTVTGKLRLSFDSLASGTTAVFSPDGRSIATTHFFNSPAVRLWDARTGIQRCSFLVGDEKTSALSVEFSKSGKELTALDGKGRLWNAETCFETWAFKGEPGIDYFAKFKPDGRLVLMQFLNSDHSVNLIDPQSGERLVSIFGHASEIRAVEITPDGKRLVTAGRDSVIKVWDMATGQELLSMAAKIGDIEGLAISPDGKILAASGGDGTIRLWRSDLNR